MVMCVMQLFSFCRIKNILKCGVDEIDQMWSYCRSPSIIHVGRSWCCWPSCEEMLVSLVSPGVCGQDKTGSGISGGHHVVGDWMVWEFVSGGAWDGCRGIG